jgi:flagellar hook capping protein FlgD
MRSRDIRRVVIVLFALLPALKVRAAAAATPFVHETVDLVGGVYTSLALDAQGNPRISHYANGDLKYAAKNGGVWTLETVDAPGDVGEFSSLALDASGNPRIAYRNSDVGDLKYAAKSGGTWAIETVDAVNFVGAYTSIKLDAQGNPRISYQDNTNQDLRFASKNFGVWTLETVDATDNVGSFTSLALDAQGNPHISYADQTNGDLKYASKSEGGVWTIETVESAGLVGFYTSLALDAQGNPRISYWDIGNSDLRYAAKNGAVWTAEPVDVTGSVGTFSSLALDAQGNPHISYRDDTNSVLKYASKSGSTWAIEIVDATANMGQYTSLALDAQGNPRISYLDGTNGDLRYTDAAVHVLAPSGGQTWPVGGLRSISWSGAGPVDVLLSVDGGRTFDPIRQGLAANTWTFRVPHAPTRFASLRVQRAVPLSTAESDSFFTIQASIALLNLKAQPVGGGGGVLLSWNTDPGPGDLAGYKIERRQGGDWRTIVGLTREIAYTDPEGKPGDRYRLTGINGLGEELVLGEASVTPQVLLAAWPLPYRQGDLSIAFAASAGPGGTPALTEVSLYDLSGRLVRTIFRETLPSGYYTATWDGRDASGERVPAGLYFLKVRTAGSESTHKVTVLR